MRGLHSQSVQVCVCVSVRVCASDSPLSDVKREGGFWHVEEQVKGRTRDTSLNSFNTPASVVSICCRDE